MAMLELVVQITDCQQKLLDTANQILALPAKQLRPYIFGCTVPQFKQLFKTYRNSLVSTMATTDQMLQHVKEKHKELIDG